MNNYQIGLLALIVLVAYLLFRNRKKKAKNQQKSGMKIFKLHEHKNEKGFTEQRSYNGDEKCYPDYPAPSPFCDDPCFSKPMAKHREANHEFRMLRMEYDTIIKRHNRISAKINRVNAAAKEFDISGPEMQEVVDLCKKDIMDAPALVEYAYKWARMQGSDTVFMPTYYSFRRLAGIYEKQGKYEEAIDICEQAIRLGLDNSDPKVSLAKRREKLIELAKKQGQKKNLVNEDEIPEPVVKSASSPGVDTTREELQAYEIIRSMAHELGMEDRIKYKDTKSYLAILVDGNVRKWICRLEIQSGPRWITFHPQNGGEAESERINQMEDLYQYRKKLVSIMKSLA